MKHSTINPITPKSLNAMHDMNKCFFLNRKSRTSSCFLASVEFRLPPISPIKQSSDLYPPFKYADLIDDKKSIGYVQYPAKKICRLWDNDREGTRFTTEYCIMDRSSRWSELYRTLGDFTTSKFASFPKRNHIHTHIYIYINCLT